MPWGMSMVPLSGKSEKGSAKFTEMVWSAGMGDGREGLGKGGVIWCFGVCACALCLLSLCSRNAWCATVLGIRGIRVGARSSRACGIVGRADNERESARGDRYGGWAARGRKSSARAGRLLTVPPCAKTRRHNPDPLRPRARRTAWWRA